MPGPEPAATAAPGASAPGDDDGGALAAMDWLLTYADCDPAGLIYYANAFVLMERLYMRWARDHGVTPDELRRRGSAVPVARSATGDFLAPLRPLDEVRARLHCDGVGRSSMDWRCTLTAPGAASPAFVGHLRQVYVGVSGRAVPVPPEIVALVGG